MSDWMSAEDQAKFKAELKADRATRRKLVKQKQWKQDVPVQPEQDMMQEWGDGWLKLNDERVGRWRTIDTLWRPENKLGQEGRPHGP